MKLRTSSLPNEEDISVSGVEPHLNGWAPLAPVVKIMRESAAGIFSLASHNSEPRLTTPVVGSVTNGYEINSPDQSPELNRP